MRKWPFPGDSPIARTRKVALAYRHLAQEQHRRALELINVLNEITVEQWTELVGDGADELFKNLHQEFGNPVEDLDKRFYDWGESWHAEQNISYQPDDYVTAQEAATLIQLSWNTIHHMRVRGRIEGVYVPKSAGSGKGTWKYKVADIYKLSAECRGRGSNSRKRTDTLADSSRGDTE